MKFPFFIGEIGINHNGDISIAKKIIKICKECGFDSVKFQKRDIDLVYKKNFLSQKRESPWGTTQGEQKKGLELSLEEYKEIDEYCKSLDIEWYASAWDMNSLAFLDQFNLKYNKVASAMIIDVNFLEEIANRGLHTFISTGMSTIENIDKAVNIFKKKNCSFELMHSVSTYPMSPEEANLLTISALKSRYGCDVGYSGHESGTAISVAASVLGVSSLERHVTLDRTMYGSDQAASLEPRGMRDLILGIKKSLIALGEEKLGHINEKEHIIAKKLREHITLK